MNVDNFLYKLTKLEDAINYSFVNKDLLIEALCHPSLHHNLILYNKNKKPFPQKFLNYERLEFLGDSVLSMVITELLFKKYPDFKEGKLAKFRGYLVSSEVLHNMANKISLGEYMLMTFGEDSANGRLNPNNLENSMEALIGATYLDGGLIKVKKLIKNLWEDVLNNIDNISYDPKTTLQELSLDNKLGIPKYEVIDTQGKSHAPLFTVKVSVGANEVIAQGKNIKTAEKEAATKLLNIMRNEDIR